MKTIKLNKALLSTIMATAAIATSSVYAHNSKADAQFYVGADAMYSKLGFKQDYGKEIFSKKFAPGINLFAGHMFNENFGMELGWEMYKKMKRSATVTSGNKAAGVYIDPAIRFVDYDTKIAQNYPYIGAVAKTNILGSDNLISLMIGASIANIKAQYTVVRTNGGPLNTIRNFNQTKPILIAKAMFEHKFNNNFGLRATATWKNTSRFKIKSKEDSASKEEIKLKDSLSFGLGATYYIM